MHYDRDGAMFYHVVMVVSDRNRPGTSLMQYLVSSGSPFSSGVGAISGERRFGDLWRERLPRSPW